MSLWPARQSVNRADPVGNGQFEFDLKVRDFGRTVSATKSPAALAAGDVL